MSGVSDKKKLRRYFSQLRASVKNDDKDLKIAEQLLAHQKISYADTVLLFASFGSEPDTLKIAETILKNGITTAFPRCDKNGGMSFHVVRELECLTEGSYGIKEPDITLPRPNITEKTVCIVPGLAFTENGERLGYGGGYYDRFLLNYPDIYTIALAYEACIADALPFEQHDIRVNMIITEERMVLCNE